MRQTQQGLGAVLPLSKSYLVLRHGGFESPGAQQAIAAGEVIAHLGATRQDGASGRESYRDKEDRTTQPAPSPPAFWIRGMLRNARAFG